MRRDQPGRVREVLKRRIWILWERRRSLCQAALVAMATCIMVSTVVCVWIYVSDLESRRDFNLILAAEYQNLRGGGGRLAVGGTAGFGDPQAESGWRDSIDSRITPEHPDNPYKLTSGIKVPGKYNFIVNHPNLCKGIGTRRRGDKDPLTYLDVVFSAGDHFEQRQILRNFFSPPDFVQRVFLLGLPVANSTLKTECFGPDARCVVDQQLLSEIRQENEKHDDIVVGDFLDVYGNLTVKTAAMHYWKVQYCPKATFAVKQDDDVAINFEPLDKMLRKRLPNMSVVESSVTEKLWPWERRALVGRLVTEEVPRREAEDERMISKAIYPSPSFPYFPRGLAYLTSQSLSEAIVRLSDRAHWIPLDDVWVRIVAGHANSAVYDVPLFDSPDAFYKTGDPCKYPVELYRHFNTRSLLRSAFQKIHDFIHSKSYKSRKIHPDAVLETFERFERCRRQQLREGVR